MARRITWRRVKMEGWPYKCADHKLFSQRLVQRERLNRSATRATPQPNTFDEPRRMKKTSVYASMNAPSSRRCHALSAGCEDEKHGSVSRTRARFPLAASGGHKRPVPRNKSHNHSKTQLTRMNDCCVVIVTGTRALVHSRARRRENRLGTLDHRRHVRFAEIVLTRISPIIAFLK